MHPRPGSFTNFSHKGSKYFPFPIYRDYTIITCGAVSQLFHTDLIRYQSI